MPEYILHSSVMDYNIRLPIKLNTGLKMVIWAVLEHVTSGLVCLTFLMFKLCCIINCTLKDSVGKLNYVNLDSCLVLTEARV